MRASGLRAAVTALATTVSSVAALPALARAAEDSFAHGDGHHGPKIVSGVEVVNAYSKVAADVAARDIAIEVADGTKFNAGDLILVWQVNGHPTPSSGDTSEIALSESAAGRFELARVDTVSDQTLELRDPMVNGFAAMNSQVVLVPEYTDVTVGVGDQARAADWDPVAGEGGVVAFFATGTVTVDGRVTANGAGFLGGSSRGGSGDSGCDGFDEPAPRGAEKGEGISGLDLVSTDGPGGTGRGNRANGGGGGVCHNSGGGGGGHRGRGGIGGRTWRSDSGTISGAGRDVGGLGGASIAYSGLARLTMGGGGGAGHQNNRRGGVGSDGGGVVLVRASAIRGTGSFEGNGDPGGDAAGEDAAGGGGAGGLVVVRTVGDLTCGTVQATGGRGGSVPTADHGPGGGGAGGHVLLGGATVSCVADVSGGGPGDQTDPTDPPGASYGALPGDDGDQESRNDGLILDADGDGLADVAEGSADTDNDGRPDFRDPDDDGDGIPTRFESPDPDMDGNPIDANDQDGDGVPDYLDIDSDGDGLTDTREAGGLDFNGDGRPDGCVDTDPFDGVCDGSALSPPNTDATFVGGDALADLLDADSDADGLDDTDEAFDRDGDRVADITPFSHDHDGDGLDDSFDGDCLGVDDPLGCRGSGAPITSSEVRDADGNGIPNWLQVCGDGHATPAPVAEGCDDGNDDDTDACNNVCRLNAMFGPCDESTDCAEVQGMICDEVTSLCLLMDASEGVCTEDSQCLSGVCDEISGNCVECIDDLDCTASSRCEQQLCIARTCGDGVIDAGEACDNGDANGPSPEACALDCRFNVGAECGRDEDCTGDATCDENDFCAVPDPRNIDSDGDGVPDAAEGLSVQGGGGFGGCHVRETRQSAPAGVLLFLLLALHLAIRRNQRS